jgi:phosphatidylethanolamine/phosphatidyl-N-methylethanolamine N-methyltransferase
MARTQKSLKSRWKTLTGSDSLLYVKSLVKSPVEVGQVTPSSRFLAEAMVANVNLANAKIVVEFGPGTGSVTRAILNRCGPHTKFFAMETNAYMVEILQRRFPHVDIVHDSAEFISKYLQKYGHEQADYVISSLPFALIEPELSQRILENTYRALKPGGAFVTYQYFHARLINGVTNRLRRNFNQIHSSLCIRNLPPAFVFQCVK